MSIIRFFFVVFCFSASIISNAQTAFLQNGNLRTVFETAKAQNKPVFIEVYSPDCHVCQAFKSTFDTKNSGDFYNKNFISYKLDIGSEEATAFFNKQHIWLPSIPVLLFFDKNVKLNHVAIMSENKNSPQVLVEAAKTALDATKNTLNYAKRYLIGDRNVNFLIEYAMMAKIQKDTVVNMEVANEYFKTQKTADYLSKTNLLVLEKVIIDMDNGLFKYLINNLPKYYAVHDKAKVNSIAENILMWSLYSSRGQRFNSTKIAQIKADLAKVGIEPKSIAGRVWMPEAAAFFRENQPAKGIAVVESRVKGMKVSGPEAKYLCSFVRSKTTDKNALAIANKWCDAGK